MCFSKYILSRVRRVKKNIYKINSTKKIHQRYWICQNHLLREFHFITLWVSFHYTEIFHEENIRVVSTNKTDLQSPWMCQKHSTIFCTFNPIWIASRFYYRSHFSLQDKRSFISPSNLFIINHCVFKGRLQFISVFQVLNMFFPTEIIVAKCWIRWFSYWDALYSINSSLKRPNQLNLWINW